MTELVYGIHAVKSILDTNPKKILKIYIISKPWNARLQSLYNKIIKHNIFVQSSTNQSLTSKVNGSTHQGIIAKIIKDIPLTEKDLLIFLKTCRKVPLLLILDGILDPHNLGACLRSADAAGVDLVIVPRDRSACLNSTVRKVSSGAAERVLFIQVINLARTIRLLKKYNIRIIGTVMKSGYNIFKIKFTGALALVMGSEKSGIRQLTKRNCDILVSIPMMELNSSLNVSVATGVCLFEILRQRQCQ